MERYSRLNLKLDADGRPSFKDAPSLIQEDEKARGLITVLSREEAAQWLKEPRSLTALKALCAYAKSAWRKIAS